MDPNDTLNTSKAGRRAAMARDGRLDQATADTVQLKPQAAQHTPGPWHIGQGNGEGSIFPESGRMRAEVGGTTLYPIATTISGWDCAEDEANARLIAAAPEMLEALRMIEAEGGSNRYAIIARAAIAKATGAQS